MEQIKMNGKFNENRIKNYSVGDAFKALSEVEDETLVLSKIKYGNSKITTQQKRLNESIKQKNKPRTLTENLGTISVNDFLELCNSPDAISEIVISDMSKNNYEDSVIFRGRYFDIPDRILDNAEVVEYDFGDEAGTLNVSDSGFSDYTVDDFIDTLNEEYIILQQDGETIWGIDDGDISDLKYRDDLTQLSLESFDAPKHLSINVNYDDYIEESIKKKPVNSLKEAEGDTPADQSSTTTSEIPAPTETKETSVPDNTNNADKEILISFGDDVEVNDVLSTIDKLFKLFSDNNCKPEFDGDMILHITGSEMSLNKIKPELAKEFTTAKSISDVQQLREDNDDEETEEAPDPTFDNEVATASPETPIETESVPPTPTEVLNGASGIINNLIKSEWSANGEYKDAAISFSALAKDNDPNVAKILTDINKVFNDIANEELTHVGELQQCLDKINPVSKSNIEAGHEEAEDKLSGNGEEAPEEVPTETPIATQDVETPEVNTEIKTPEEEEKAEKEHPVDEKLTEGKSVDLRDEKEIKDAKDSMNKDEKGIQITRVIDPNAGTDKDLIGKEYVGKALLQCPSCLSLIVKDVDDLKKAVDADLTPDDASDNPNATLSDRYNVGDTCPCCNYDGKNGFIKVGDIADATDAQKAEVKAQSEDEEPKEEEDKEEPSQPSKDETSTEPVIEPEAEKPKETTNTVK